ncbi:MAG: PilZ domain-containing protein [Leptospiraceae bacterium]|nr:PilZ domain-containing protein [Leptospiraceae bacterium]MDW8307569.1 PilZ domain-containing protein [Leptospiraceae bacterium]
MAIPRKDMRRYPRADVRLKVEYTSLGTGVVETTHTHDLSASGVCFETEKMLERGERLRLRFTIPDINRQIEAEAIVVRSFEYEERPFTAVEFIDIPYDDFLTILDYSLALFDEQQEKSQSGDG